MKRNFYLIALMFIVSIVSYGQGIKQVKTFKKRNLPPTNVTGSNLKFTSIDQQSLDYEIESEWDGAQWNEIYKYEYLYSESGQIEVQTGYQKDNGTWVNSSKAEFSYDENHNVTAISTYDWENEVWVGYYKQTYTYNLDELLSQEIESEWDIDHWEDDYKTEYSYNVDGDMITAIEYSWDESAWVFNDKTEYTYNAEGLMNQFINYSFNNGNWENSYRIDYTFDADNLPAQKIEYSWQSDAWQFSEKGDYVIDNMGNTISESYSQYESDNSDWRNSNYYEYTYDNAILYSDLLAPSKNNLIPDYYDLIVSKPLTFISMEWDIEDEVWKDSWKGEYFYNGVNTNIESTQYELKVYPSAVESNLTVEIPALQEPVSFTLYDLTGRNVLDIQIQNTQSISLESLSKGVYMYNVVIDNKKISGKVVKK